MDKSQSDTLSDEQLNEYLRHATTLVELVAAYRRLKRHYQHAQRFYTERMDALQQYQAELPEPHRTYVCDILANGQKRTWPVKE